MVQKQLRALLRDTFENNNLPISEGNLSSEPGASTWLICVGAVGAGNLLSIQVKSARETKSWSVVGTQSWHQWRRVTTKIVIFS